MLTRKRLIKPVVAAALIAASVVYAAMQPDFGEKTEQGLKAQSQKLFGFNNPLAESASTVIDRADGQPASDRQLLANGLISEFVARNVARSGDMIAFWPDDLNYTHLIVCIEQGRSGTTPGNNGGYNAAVQRVNVTPGPDYGEVETILHGMDRCDGIRTTPWGTVLATEEVDDGAAYEIIDPLNTTGYWIYDRGSAGVDADIRIAVDDAIPNSGEDKVKKRIALVTQSWEGLEVLDNGVVIGGDELRPNLDSDGGAIFRFVPDQFYDCGNDPVRPGQLCENLIDDLDDSPLRDGQNYALATVCSGTDDFGQGCEAGRGLWVEVNAATARTDANDSGATGYCRPEDLQVDRSYGEFVGGEGIRWCWTNTCGGGFGEVMCVVENAMDAKGTVFNDDFDNYLLSSNGSIAEADVTRFVGGDPEMNSHDNLDIQPYTNNVYVIEDFNTLDEEGGTGGDVWACLPDGNDRDLMTDGCVRMLSIRDPEAEPTGFIFDGTGTTAYYIVQHGQNPGNTGCPAETGPLDDCTSNPVDGRTDDLIKITGFKVKNGK